MNNNCFASYFNSHFFFRRTHEMLKRIHLKDGLKIAYDEWGVNNKKKVLAVHGWMDNLHSFSTLGPYLANFGYHTVAIDNIGHGLSSHLPNEHHYCVARNMSDIEEVTRALGWARSSVIGHSMGGAPSVHFAVNHPDRIDKLVVLEMFGPVSSGAQLMRTATAESVAASVRQTPHKAIASVGTAVAMKQKAAATYSSGVTISPEAARLILARGVRLLSHSHSGDSEEHIPGVVHDDEAGPILLRHDPRLSIFSYIFHSRNEVMGLLPSVRCPVLCLDGQTGWRVADGEVEAQIQTLTRSPHFQYRHLPGSHHLHVDPHSRDQTQAAILDFLGK